MFQNKRFIKLLIILFILGSGALYLLRGVPSDEIPYPDTTSYGDVKTTYSGRPIPYNEILLAYRSWFDLKVIIYNDLNDGHEFYVPGHVTVSVWDVGSRKPYTVMPRWASRSSISRCLLPRA
jgi:hypothetical protein